MRRRNSQTHAQIQIWSGLGDNRFGQLGLSSFHEEQAAYPQSVRDLNALGLRPTAVECGDNVCMALTGGGEVWGWGTGETMQLCRQHQPAADQPSDELLGAGEDVHSPVRLCFPFQKKGNSQTHTQTRMASHEHAFDHSRGCACAAIVLHSPS